MVVGCKTLQVSNHDLFHSEGQGEFDSDLMIIVDKNEFEAVPEADALTVEDALQLTVNGGKIGNLHVDPNSLSLDGVGRF